MTRFTVVVDKDDPGRRASRRGESRAARFATEAVPLYYQLGSVLREKILSGQSPPGDRLPTEAELSDEYGVSRITVRQALSALEEEGLIRREAGRGTFVKELPKFTGDLKVEGSLDDLIFMGQATSIQLLELRTVEATPQQAERLQLPLSSTLTRCARLRFYHDEPLSYVVMLVPHEIGRQVRKPEWKRGSVLKALERLGYVLRDADQTVTASLADATLARLLRTRIGSPLLSVDRLVRTREGRPLQLVHTFYRSDIYSVKVHLVRHTDAGQEAVWSLRHGRKAR
jgi:GntR family transcriptional regulator